MSQTNPTTPRPSTDEMQRRLAAELSPASRLLYAALLLIALAVSGATISLLATEPDLPARTTLALGAVALGGLCWAGLFGWTIARRKVLLGRHRVIAGLLASAMSALFLAGSVGIALVYPPFRTAASGAAASGAVFLIAALLLWARARRRHRELVARREELSKRLSDTGASVWLLAAALLAAALPSGLASAQTLATDALEVEIGATPVPMAALGRLHLAYELHVTNMGTEPRRIERLAVLEAGGDAPLAAWAGADLARRLAPVGAPPAAGSGERPLAPGARTIAFLWVTLEPGVRTPPSAIRHRIVSLAADGSDRRVLETDAIEIAEEAEPLETAPVDAGRWVAIRAPAPGSVHRRALVTLDGRSRIPTRFAVDWARLGQDGRLYSGDGTDNRDWYGYGDPVRAVRQGRVVRVIDDLPEHGPRSPEVQRSFERETVSGNTVVVDHGTGRHAVYAHLQPGSIPVREGQRVAAGELLGRIGNSGLSLAPHLHFHVVEGSEPMASEGVPFGLREYQLIGQIPSLGSAVAGTPWESDPRRPARTVRGEIPMENMVLELAAVEGR